MRILDRIATVVGFRVIPTTVLVLLTYVTIFTLVIVTDWLPEPPKTQNGLDLKQAYTDLRHVSARLPHNWAGYSSVIPDHSTPTSVQLPLQRRSTRLYTLATPPGGSFDFLCSYIQ